MLLSWLLVVLGVPRLIGAHLLVSSHRFSPACICLLLQIPYFYNGMVILD